MAETDSRPEAGDEDADVACSDNVGSKPEPTLRPQEPPPPNQPPPPGYYPPPPPSGYYPPPPPPGYYPPPPPPGYYPPPPPGYYQQPPPPGYYYPPPPQDVGRRGQVLIDRRPPRGPPSGGPWAPGPGAPGPGQLPQDSRDTFFEAFNDPAIRTAFVRKVYSILSLQLLYTTVVIATCVLVPPARNFVRRYYLLAFLAFLVEFVLYIVLVCCDSVRRKVPLNFVLLSFFTMAFAYLAGFISAFYSTQVVLYTFAITTVVCVLVSLLAIFSCVDITSCGIVLCILSLSLLVFFLFIIVLSFFLRVRILLVVYSGLVALLMCAYLMYDTQQILGGRNIELSPEEYVLGAISLYTDIIIMFIHLLRLVACCLDED